MRHAGFQKRKWLSEHKCPGKCEWFKDVVEDGDIERNPGPQSARNKTCKFTSCMVNANGASNTWAFTRWITCQRPVLAVVQEHCSQAGRSGHVSFQARIPVMVRSGA